MQAVRLGQLLIQAKVLQQSQLDAALSEQKRSGGKLGEVLVRLNLVSEAQLTLTLASQQGVAVVDLDALQDLPHQVVQALPPDVAHAYQVIPLELSEADHVLVVAAAEVPRGPRLEALRSASGAWIVPRLAAQSAISRALNRFYGDVRAPSPAAASRRNGAKDATSAQIRALVDLLEERGIVTWDDYLSRIRR